MIVIEEAGVELDFCIHCKGAWFDSGELELLLDKIITDETINDIVSTFSDAGNIELDRKMKCPRCSQKMKKLSVSEGGKSVVIDSCPIGDGLWFDKGETSDVMKNIAKTKGGDAKKIAEFLKIFN